MGSQAHPSTFRPKPVVLIVEDDVFIAMALEAALVDAGYTVIGPALSVAMAMSLLRVEKPDVAVLDYNLLDDTVEPVAERLSAMEVPFILSSAREAEVFADPVFANIENLGKPASLKEMVEAVAELAA